MANVEERPGVLTLYTCHIDDGGPPVHPCRRAHEALRAAGHEYRTVVLDRKHPLGFFTRGKRPELKRISGQERLPVLQMPEGDTVNGSRDIIAWARQNAPRRSGTPAQSG
jgi:glutathione S-transferase